MYWNVTLDTLLDLQQLDRWLDGCVVTALAKVV